MPALEHWLLVAFDKDGKPSTHMAGSYGTWKPPCEVRAYKNIGGARSMRTRVLNLVPTQEQLDKGWSAQDYRRYNSSNAGIVSIKILHVSIMLDGTTASEWVEE